MTTPTSIPGETTPLLQNDTPIDPIVEDDDNSSIPHSPIIEDNFTKRHLTSEHLQMISIGGTIGTGKNLNLMLLRSFYWIRSNDCFSRSWRRVSSVFHRVHNGVLCRYFTRWNGDLYTRKRIVRKLCDEVRWSCARIHVSFDRLIPKVWLVIISFNGAYRCRQNYLPSESLCSFGFLSFLLGSGSRLYCRFCFSLMQLVFVRLEIQNIICQVY
jgi:hypothetical protein